MFIKKNKIKNLLEKTILNIFCHIQNYNNCNIKKNGETVFIKNMFKFFSKNKNKKLLMFDIGANVGDYTQSLIEFGNNNNLQTLIYSFEPTKSCLEILNNKFNNNPQIKLFPQAVSEKQEETKIYYDMDKSHLASLYKRELDYYSISMDKSEVISTVRLDTIIEKENIEHINFIKIDTEGNELSVLKSLGKYLNPHFIDFIQLEYGGTYLDAKISLREVYELLEKSGFNVAKIMPKGIELSSYEPWMDNFQFVNYVAISQTLNIN